MSSPSVELDELSLLEVEPTTTGSTEPVLAALVLEDAGVFPACGVLDGPGVEGACSCEPSPGPDLSSAESDIRTPDTRTPDTRCPVRPSCPVLV